MDNNKIGQTAAMNADPEMKPSTKPTPPPQEDAPVQPPKPEVPPETKPQATSMGATVAGGEIVNGKLFITLKGKSPGALQTMEAKTMAYNERFHHGVSQAGIEMNGPPWPCNDKGEAYTPGRDTAVDHYRALFKITPG